MSFKSLEQRFNERVNVLYGGATTKFDGGKPSTGRTDEPYILRRPGDSQRGLKLEGRSAPVISAANDVRRLSLFQISSRGLVFLAKQQLLQTGNTFASTRLVNPTFVVGNAIPFTHVLRHIDTSNPIRSIGRSLVGGLLGQNIANRIFGSGQQKDVGSLRRIAGLQQETYDKFVGGSPTNFLKKIPVIGKIISAVGAKRSIGEVGTWETRRPELGRGDFEYVLGGPRRLIFKYGGKVLTPDLDPLFVKSTYGVQPRLFNWDGRYTTYLAETDGERTTTPSSINLLLNTDYLRYSRTRINWKQPTQDYRSNLLSETAKKVDETNQLASYQGPIQSAVDDQQKKFWTKYLSSLDPASPSYYIKYFTAGTAGIKNRFAGTNASELAENVPSDAVGKKITYVRDPLNQSNSVVSNTGKVLKPYEILPQIIEQPNTGDIKLSDIITVSFAMGRDNHVQFRAFIKDITENVQPEYKPYQYIGRIEKFITFSGTQRDVSFKLHVLAFGEDELEFVWTRINYLTSFAFPYGFNRGIYQPNVIRMTIGDLYKDQPAYLTSLNTNFNEAGESWEISPGKQVPLAATLNMKFTLIEKDSKWAEKPFYEITRRTFNQTKESDAAQVPDTTPSTIPPQEIERFSPQMMSRDDLLNLSSRSPTGALIRSSGWTSPPPRVEIPNLGTLSRDELLNLNTRSSTGAIIRSSGWTSPP